jgi:PAS domain-containing protein/DNA-binding CsgD family transcriptional regulator
MSDNEFRKTEFYQNHCRPTGTAYVLGAVVTLDSRNGARGVIGIHRSESEERFSETDKRYGRLILPHLRRAMQLRERLSQLDIQRKSLLDATDALGVGVIVVSQDAGILSANPLAEALLRRVKGLCVRNNRLMATQPFHDDKLRRIIWDAARASAGRSMNAGGLVRVPCSNGKPLALSVYPFTTPSSTDGSTVPAALIFIADLAAAHPPKREALAEMYALTAAEARLFEALLTGERLQDYADRVKLSVQTTKSQLAHIF